MSSANNCGRNEGRDDADEMQLDKKRVKLDGSQEEEARAHSIIASSSLSNGLKDSIDASALTNLANAALEYQQQQQQQQQKQKQQQQQQQRISVVLPICTNTSIQGQFLEEGIAPFVTKLYELVSNKENSRLVNR